jgi:uncharacterized protein (TIGR03437 family)
MTCLSRIAACGVLLAGVVRAQEIRLTQVASGINAPTDIQTAGDSSGRLFLVQQNGLIKILRNGAVSAQPFLDITGKTRQDGERGLLGLAFPPGFAEKRRFYVDYTDLNGDTIIAMYRVSAGSADVADGTSETVLTRIAQPFANHNGGQVRFGPDGYLYVGMGDGGSGGDPQKNGQNRNVLLGKMLRLDVESQPGKIVIPPDNPLVGVSGTRPEIWAYGLRNSWRYSFDRATGDLWIADVGQDAYEEIDFQPAASRGGENYGWNLMEGLHCTTSGCSQQGLTLPIAEYSHAQGCSVAGGFVYRGNGSPGLRGTYIYGDYCSGRIWGVAREGGAWVSRLLLASGLSIITFGEDQAGEVYLGAANGAIYRIDGSRAPRFSAANVVNSASYAAGLTPGSLNAVFAAGVLDAQGVIGAPSVPLGTTLSGVSVTVAGIPAPILAVANVGGQEQVNFQTPFEVRGRATAAVVVTREGQASAAVDVAVVDPQPAIYSGDGVNALVVHAADYTLATAAKPLQPNEDAFLYAAGLGAVANQPATGGGAPADPPARTASDAKVTLGGAVCEVQYSGLAPGLVGVYQVNFRVPANAAAGAQDVVLSIGGAQSPALKTVVAR